MLNNSSPLSNDDGKVQNFSIEWECGTCRCNIVYGNSVLLMFGCFNIPQCQICIRFLLAYWVTGGKGKLNEQGIRCVACKNYTPVDNIPAVRKEAKRLVLQGRRVLMGYQQNLLPNADGFHSLPFDEYQWDHQISSRTIPKTLLCFSSLAWKLAAAT